MQKATWVKLLDIEDWHAVKSVMSGVLWISHCGLQWTASADWHDGKHSKLQRCDTCQSRAIAAARHDIGLDDLERTVLWERDMVDV